MEKTASSLGYTEEEYRRFKRQGIRYLLLFSVLYMTHYCSRLNLTNASALMIEELHWTKADIGVLSSALFWAYGIGQLVNGRLSEIVGAKKFLFLSILLSIAANLLLGFQSSLVIMTLLCVVNGYFQSMAWCPGMTMLTRWWPANRRGFAVGFAHAFSGFGQVVATFAVVAAFRLLPDLGWRAAFFLPPAVPLVMLLVFTVFVKTSPTSIGLSEYIEADAEKADQEEDMQRLLQQHGKLYPYLYVLRNNKFILWGVIAFIAGLARYGLTTWIPLYFVDRFSIDITDGLLQSAALPIGMGIGTLTIPSLTDRFCPRDRVPAVIISSVAAAAFVWVFFFLDPRIPVQAVLLELTLFFAGFFIYAINGVSLVHAVDLGGRVFSGTSSGILSFCSYLGAGVQSLLYGFLLETAGWNMVFGSLSLLCLLAAVLGMIVRRSRYK